MLYKVIRVDLVKLDVEEALDFYDSISPDLGMRFENDIRNTFKKLEKSPYNYFNLEHGYRRVNLKTFPYMIVYKIENQTNTVKILGVFHQHSNPIQFIKG